MRSSARITLCALAVLIAGCGTDNDAPSFTPPSSSSEGATHIHGLGINPADDTLYAATHTGLFTVRDGAGQRVADRLQDTMGFTVVGPDHFLGSGHPDFRDPSCTSQTAGPCSG